MGIFLLPSQWAVKFVRFLRWFTTVSVFAAKLRSALGTQGSGLISLPPPVIVRGGGWLGIGRGGGMGATPPSTHYIVGLIKGREVFSGCSDQVPGTTEIKIDASTNVHVSTKSRWESWMNNQNDGWLYIGHCLLLKQQGVYTRGPHHVFSFSLLSLGKSMVRIPELLLVFS